MSLLMKSVDTSHLTTTTPPGCLLREARIMDGISPDATLQGAMLLFNIEQAVTSAAEEFGAIRVMI